MSEEIKEEKGTSMYVHQIEFETLLALLERVTDVNKVYTYNMPNKAEKYASSGFELINTLNEYIGGEEDWRINKESNVKLNITEGKIIVGNTTMISGTKLIMCIPRINSILIIPDDESLINGVKDPTKIIQFTNCISVTPLLVRLSDEPVEGEEGKYHLGMTMEVIVPKTEEKPTE